MEKMMEDCALLTDLWFSLVCLVLGMGSGFFLGYTFGRGKK